MNDKSSRSERLLDALTQLLKRQPIETIKLSEILRVAGVSHSTFYRAYPTKNDFYVWVLNFYLNGLSQTAKHVAKTPVDFYDHYFNFVYENRLYFKTFTNGVIWPQFTDLLYQVGVKEYDQLLKWQTSTSEQATIISNYVVHAHVGVLLAWLNGDMTATPHQLAVTVSEMTRAALTTQHINLGTFFPR